MKDLRYPVEIHPRDAPDEWVRGGLWRWHFRHINAVKHERRVRFKDDLDDHDAPAVFDE